MPKQSFDIDYNATSSLNGLIELFSLAYKHNLTIDSYIADGPAGGNSEIIVSAENVSDLDDFKNALYS